MVTKFLVLCACFLLVNYSPGFSDSVDTTLQTGSVGAIVVEACVTKIRQSGIFPEDYNFLRRIAYVETLDGAELDTQEPGGIWQLSSTKFTQIMNSSYDVSSYYAGMNSAFGIDWTTVHYDNMSIPLYSALSMRLLLAYLETSTNVEPSTEALQSAIWAVSITSSEETVTHFLERVATISTGCNQPNRDVVFLIDSSIESGDVYFSSAKSVVANVITLLKIDSNPNATVVGVAQYSNVLREVTYLNGSSSESDVLALVSNTELLSGSRHTGLVTANVLTDYFTPANGGKGWSSGFPQVLCIITGGNSDDSVDNINVEAADAGVNVIAIGLTTDATLAHLNKISTGRDSETSISTSNFTSTTALEHALKRQICESAIVPQTGITEITGVVETGTPKYVTLSVPAAGIDTSVRTSSGAMDMYYSALITAPSSGYYDYSLTVASPNVEVPFRYVPTSTELESYDGVTVYLYITLENPSSLPAIFAITLDETVATIAITVNTPNTTVTSNPPVVLSPGEIAGIVFSCLIVLCAMLVALVYYRFGKPTPGTRLLMHRDKLDRPMDSRAHQKRLEINVRERLQSAIRRRDVGDLSDAVEDFMALKMEDYTGDFVKAQRMIAVHQCKQGITYAMNLRNIKALEKAIFRGKRMEYDVELKIELVNAEILLQDLKKIDNLLRRLKRAIDGSDLPTAEAVTAELRILRGCDQSVVDRMLLAFQFREDIEEAMLRRDINGIKESIARIEEKGVESELMAELKQARKMVKDLTIVEKARNEVMGLKQSRVSEIKSYATPPPGVHEVMMAVYLLLGYHPMQIQSWTAIQSLMGKTGREGLRRMIGELELTAVDVMHARMAKSLLDNFDLHAIRDISEALAVFYTFARSMIKEVEKFLPEGDQDSASYSDILDDSGNFGVTPFILR